MILSIPNKGNRSHRLVTVWSHRYQRTMGILIPKEILMEKPTKPSIKFRPKMKGLLLKKILVYSALFTFDMIFEIFLNFHEVTL